MLTVANTTIFKITDAKLYVPIVEDNAKLWKLLGEGFKRSIYWNKYNVTDNKLAEIAATNKEKPIRELLDSSLQGVKRLFVLVYNNKAGNDQFSVDSYKKYFLPREKKQKADFIEIMEETFMINQLMTQLNKTTK